MNQLAGLIVLPERPPLRRVHELIERDRGTPKVGAPFLVDVAVVRQRASDRVAQHDTDRSAGREQFDRLIGQVAGDEQRLVEQGRGEADEVIDEEEGARSS